MDLNVTERAPLPFRLGKFMIRTGVPGGHRTLVVARRLGLLGRVVDYTLLDGYRLGVPIGRSENDWDRRDLLAYEHHLVSSIVDATSDLSGPTALVDCGADIGTISVLLAMRTGKLAKVFAVEPNEAVWKVLRHNVSRLPMPGEAIPAAIADFAGRGRFGAPDHDRSSDHARFLVPDPDGPISVMRIDDLPLQGFENVVLKIDVEGGEAAAIAGAARTIARTEAVVVAFEAHPEQIKRTGIDPTSILKALNAIRPCDARVCEAASARIDLDRPFFDQFGRDQIYNLVCRSAASKTQS